jgi:hypothetical protein
MDFHGADLHARVRSEDSSVLDLNLTVKCRPTLPLRNRWMHMNIRMITSLPKYLAKAKRQKTYNRRDSQMVTHSSTSRPVQCLCMAERTEYTVVTHPTPGNSAGLSVQFDSRNSFLDEFLT